MDYSKERSVKFLRSAAQALHEENRRLRQERAEFERERAALLEQQAEAEREHAALLEQQAEVERERVALLEQKTEMLAQLAELEAKLAALLEKLARRDRQLFGRKTERRSADNAAAGEASEATPEAKAQARKKKKKGTGHGPTPQPALPVVEVVHTLVDEGLRCRHCGGELGPLGTEAEEAELIALEERRLVLERHLRMKYQCPCCNTGVTTAPGPVKLIPGGRYALSFTLEVAFLKYLAHLPFERQAQLFRHEGLKVTTATLFDQVDALATTLTPTYQAIWKALQQEPVLCADETPWAVLSNGHTANERFYAWCAVGSQFVGYRLLDTRSAEGAATLLGSFSGTLMVDGLTSYPAAAKGAAGEPPKWLTVNCHAHARRKFVECEQHAPDESRFVIDLYQQLYAIERAGREPGADLAALRAAQSRPLVDQLFAWARDQQARRDVLPASGLAKALAYLLNHETGLRAFLDHPAVPIDNNAAERAMRAPVLGRKNHYGSRSRRGTETAAILYTLIESAKRVDVSPKAYLEAAVEWALSRPGAVLLPDEFKRQLDAAGDTPPPDG